MADFREDGWEWLHYDDPDFQVQYRNNFIPADYTFDGMIMHRHDDVEFIYVIKGSILYEMEDETVRMSEGEGIFVNSRQMHVIKSDFNDCQLFCLIFHPIILASSEYIIRNHVMPVIGDKSLKYVMLSEKTAWQKQILYDISDMEKYTLAEDGHLQIMRYIYEIWDCLYSNLVDKKEKEDTNSDLYIMKKMISFIHKNYRNKIRLVDICEAGNIGKTKCNVLFSEYYNMTPIEYLCNYRLEKGAQLLEISDMAVTEKAFETGFTDASYFSRLFGKKIGCSPQEYRCFGKGMSRLYDNSENTGV